jgi:hypothetical protein
VDVNPFLCIFNANIENCVSLPIPHRIPSSPIFKERKWGRAGRGHPPGNSPIAGNDPIFSIRFYRIDCVFDFSELPLQNQFIPPFLFYKWIDVGREGATLRVTLPIPELTHFFRYALTGYIVYLISQSCPYKTNLSPHFCSING